MKHFLPLFLFLWLTACTARSAPTSSAMPVSATGDPLSINATDDQFQVIQTYETSQVALDWPQSILDSAYPPLDVYGYEGVSIGADGEVYLIHLPDGKREQITSDGLIKGNAVLSDRYIAWFAQTGNNGAVDIFVFDRETQQEQKISLEPALRIQLVLDGTYLVWADQRNETNTDNDFDLYGYDLASGTEYPIALAPGAQYSPALFRNRVVWQDNRNSPAINQPLAGCGNCPENRFDIYLFDFETGISQVLVENEWLKANPAIYEDTVVWVEYHPLAESDPLFGLADLYLVDLQSNKIQQITATPDSENAPLLAGNRLVWTIGTDCDVIEIGEDGKEILPAVGIYLLELDSRQLYHVSSEKEPRALFDQNYAIVQAGCMTYTYTAISLPQK